MVPNYRLGSYFIDIIALTLPKPFPIIEQTLSLLNLIRGSKHHFHIENIIWKEANKFESTFNMTHTLDKSHHRKLTSKIENYFSKFCLNLETVACWVNLFTDFLESNVTTSDLSMSVTVSW